MKDKSITIKDIALKANTSIGTVDRVLHKRGRVAIGVEERILQIIKELDYKPNVMARALSSKKQYNISVLIPDDTYDPYWVASKEGINKALKELKQYGLKVKFYFFDPYNTQSFIEKALELRKQAHDAVIITPILRREVLPFLALWEKENIPFVFFNTEIFDYKPLSYVGQDSYQSGYLAAKLIHYGQSDPCSFLIAHFSKEATNAAHLEKKELGFRDYFLQNNLTNQFEIIQAEITGESNSLFIEQMDDIFRKTPSIKGVFVTTSKAFEIAEYLSKKHIENVKLIGYDLIEKNINHLKNNRINFLINQNPKGQAFWALQILADKLVFSKEVPLSKYLPLDIITKENLSYFLED